MSTRFLLLDSAGSILASYRKVEKAENASLALAPLEPSYVVPFVRSKAGPYVWPLEGAN